MPTTVLNNQVLSSLSCFEPFEGKLQLLAPLKDTNLALDCWQFKTSNGLASLDFSMFELPHTQFISSIPFKYDDQTGSLSCKELAKLLFLCQVTEKSKDSLVVRFNTLLRLFAFLAEKRLHIVEQDSLESLYSFMMTTDVTKGSAITRYSALGFNSCIKFLNYQKIRSLLTLFSVEVLLGAIPQKQQSKALNSACLATAGMTSKDYQEGGSFNFLTLDIGRYYVDHCANYFEKHYSFGVALACTIREASASVQEELEGAVNQKTLSRHINYVLMGRDIVAEPLTSNSGHKHFSSDKLSIIQSKTLEIFWKHLKGSYTQTYLQKATTLQSLADHFELRDRFDTLEFLRSLIFSRFNKQLPKSRLKILKEYQACVESDDFKRITLKDFDKTCDSFVDKLEQSSLIDLWRDVGQSHREGGDGVNDFISSIESAGVTLFVAQTGWRQSEYGFPLSAILVENNKDILDSSYSPFRFHVKWTVPKTAKSTKLEREITLSSYILASQLSSLVAPDQGFPCLYNASAMKSNVFKSDKQMTTRVNKHWKGFVLENDSFSELEQLEVLSNKTSLTTEDRELQSLLLKKYPNDYKTAELKWVKNKLREDLPRLLTANRNAADSHTDSLSARIFAYSNGTLECQHKDIFEQYVDEEILEKVKQAGFCSANEVPKDLISLVSEQILDGVVYPSPHAFRHMWAEAVLRRYRGDVGKFIRANFKHIDERFFMRYLKNKDVRAIFEMAKRTTINSMVKSHLMAVRDDYREMAGRFDVFIRRLSKATTVVGIDDLIEKAQDFSEHNIVDIKANSWATCILRRSTYTQAKCSINGVPQRQNASPSLCLGCVNGDINEGNFTGIMLTVKNDVQACLNPELPTVFKAESIEMIKLAKKRVRELHRNSGNERYEDAISIFDKALLFTESQQVK